MSCPESKRGNQKTPTYFDQAWLEDTQSSGYSLEYGVPFSERRYALYSQIVCPDFLMTDSLLEIAQDEVERIAGKGECGAFVTSRYGSKNPGETLIEIWRCGFGKK